MLWLMGICPFLFAQIDEAFQDTIQTSALEEVVITASKQKERLLQAPVSIEVLDQHTIRQSAQPGFFEAIQNLKGIQVLTPSLGFRVINARGFANTTNVRFVQMVDGVDNQAPHIGAPIANSLGPNDLDVLRVEIIPGSSSAVYGMNAINGIANFITKDPFTYQGISVQQKSGFNNLNAESSKPTYYNETSFRMARAFHKTIAFKINGTMIQGTDWAANNRLDLNPLANLSTALTGHDNPGSDLVNIYGDEQGNRRTITLAGKQYVISRTGYAEKELTDYGLKNFKADGGIFYALTTSAEFSYIYRIAHQNNIYQRTNRFRFHDYFTQQHVLNFKSNSVQIRSYLTTENTGKSYNIRSMGENIDRGFKGDNVWFADFTKQAIASAGNGLPAGRSLQEARAFADNGRLLPASEAFSNKINDLSKINNWDVGAALRVKAKMYNLDFQHDLTNTLLLSLKDRHGVHLMYGFDLRDYNIVPDGNYFINPKEAGKNLNYWKTGGFLQATKSLFQEKLKINGVIRIDKNQYYNPKINPRLAMVYSPVPTHI